MWILTSQNVCSQQFVPDHQHAYVRLGASSVNSTYSCCPVQYEEKTQILCMVVDPLARKAAWNGDLFITWLAQWRSFKRSCTYSTSNILIPTESKFLVYNLIYELISVSTHSKFQSLFQRTDHCFSTLVIQKWEGKVK